MVDEHTSEDPELEAFAALARSALLEADPPPADVSTIARLAFQFRSVPTVEGTVLDDDPRLVGVRGAAGADVVRHGDVTLTWNRDGGEILGLVDPPAGHHVDLQTLDGTEALDLDTDGSFRHAEPAGPHRLVVTNSDGTWATPWTS